MNEERERQRVVTVAAIAVIADISFKKAEKALDKIVEKYNEQLRLRIEYGKKIKEQR